VRSFLVHLRLHFQLILSGIFLWAFLLAGGIPSRRALLAFLILHVCLYGGTTAYNAWYDQDEGPVTGLRRPPRAGRACLVGGLAFMGLGALLAPRTSPTFAGIYVLIMLLSIGYSHPRVRFKDGPLSSLVVVALGQGVLGYLAGAAVAVRRGLPEPTPELVLGGIAATLFTTGLYPLTQVFQIEEDLRRGDRTFAAHFGPRVVFRTALACFGAGLVAAVPAALAVFTRLETGILAGALGLLVLGLWRWSRRYDAQARFANHDRVLTLGLVTSASFVALVVRHLAARLP
jgi:1,4-dihydroxy-2-naphthoate octaprenyltransferase